MSVLDKFILKPEHKEEFKKELVDMIDKQFDAYQESYSKAFKGLPYEVLENMTEKQASELITLVVNEATSSMKFSLEALAKEMKKVADDPEKMDAIRKKFMEGINGEQMVADIPDVPKNTMEVE